MPTISFWTFQPSHHENVIIWNYFSLSPLLLILKERLYDATILERFLIYIGNKVLLSPTTKVKVKF